MSNDLYRAEVKTETAIDSANHTSGFGIIKNSDVIDKFHSGFGVLKSARKKAQSQIKEIQQNIPLNKNIKLHVVRSKPLKNKLTNLTDEQIFNSVERVFELMNIFPKGTLLVDVNNSWITLTGTVDWQFQHDATVAAINQLKGVIGFTDHIHVNPEINLVEKITS
jgi:hypothetical protein